MLTPFGGSGIALMSRWRDPEIVQYIALRGTSRSLEIYELIYESLRFWFEGSPDNADRGNWMIAS